MSKPNRPKVALVYPGDRAARDSKSPENNRFRQVAAALDAEGVDAAPAVYHDDFVNEVRQQLSGVDGVLVWVNPIEGGRDRSVLDAMLRDVAASGAYVSTHPDIILKLGTKEVLYTTRSMSWGGDVHLYTSPDALRRELPHRLAAGQARVLKQYRGNGGNGVWKVQAVAPGVLQSQAPLLVRHAKRGCVEERLSLADFLERCMPYFEKGGRMIDQPYQERLMEGMVRCYLVHDRVAGFGHQAINALYPAPPGAAPQDAPQPGPRLYHPPDKPEFQALKQQMESQWVPDVQQLLGIAPDELPALWDADFLLGPKDASGQDSYILCEINVSSVSPFPESATPILARAVAQQVRNRSWSRCGRVC